MQQKWDLLSVSEGILEHHEMPEYRRDQRRVPVYLRQRGITFIRPTVKESELGGERMQMSTDKDTETGMKINGIIEI